MTATTLTAAQRQRYAIVKATERRAAELAPLLAEVDRLVAEIGWSRARPVVREVLGPLVKVTGPRGAWRHRVGKRVCARIVAALSDLPAQERFTLDAHPRRSLGVRTEVGS